MIKIHILNLYPCKANFYLAWVSIVLFFLSGTWNFLLFHLMYQVSHFWKGETWVILILYIIVLYNLGKSFWFLVCLICKCYLWGQQTTALLWVQTLYISNTDRDLFFWNHLPSRVLVLLDDQATFLNLITIYCVPLITVGAINHTLVKKPNFLDLKIGKLLT